MNYATQTTTSVIQGLSVRPVGAEAGELAAAMRAAFRGAGGLAGPVNLANRIDQSD